MGPILRRQTGFARPCYWCEQEIDIWEDQDGSYYAIHYASPGNECPSALGDFVDYSVVFFIKGVWT